MTDQEKLKLLEEITAASEELALIFRDDVSRLTNVLGPGLERLRDEGCIAPAVVEYLKRRNSDAAQASALYAEAFLNAVKSIDLRLPT